MFSTIVNQVQNRSETNTLDTFCKGETNLLVNRSDTSYQDSNEIEFFKVSYIKNYDVDEEPLTKEQKEKIAKIRIDMGNNVFDELEPL